MSDSGRIVRAFVAGVALLGAVACSPVYNYHGFVPGKEDLDELAVGLDTRATVESIIGKPGASGLLAESGWYYVRSEFEHDSFRPVKEITREVVAISFDDDGIVKNIERFGLERGQVVVLSRRVTDSNIEGVGFLRQLFGNAGQASNFGQFFN